MAVEAHTLGTQVRQRALAYRLFATLLSRDVIPADKAAAALLGETCTNRWAADSQCCLTSLTRGLEKIATALPSEADQATYTELAHERARLFDDLTSKPAAPPYQSRYSIQDARHQSVTEMRDLLRVLNLRASHDFGSSDHVAVELTVMAVLVERESTQWERDFLHDRLLQWIPLFAERVKEAARLDFFVVLLSTLEEFLQADETYLRSL